MVDAGQHDHITFENGREQDFTGAGDSLNALPT